MEAYVDLAYVSHRPTIVSTGTGDGVEVGIGVGIGVGVGVVVDGTGIVVGVGVGVIGGVCPLFTQPLMVMTSIITMIETSRSNGL